MTADTSSTVLLTRPLAASKRWADLLSARGLACVIEPLLLITPSQQPRPAGRFQAVMLTSATVGDALPQLPDSAALLADLLALPCFCVGAATAQAAQALGFTTLRSGNDDSVALAQEMAAALDPAAGPVLHIAGDMIEGGGPRLLEESGFTVTSWQIYEALAASDFTPAVRAALASDSIRIIPVFSPRTARILVALIERNRLTAACHAMTAIGFSPAVADVLRVLPWRHLAVAARPDEAAMLDEVLRERPATVQTDAALPPAGRRRLPVGAALTAAALIAGGLGYLAVRAETHSLTLPMTTTLWPDTAPALFAPPRPQNPLVDLVALQQRVKLLEQRLDTAPDATPPLPPPVMISADQTVVKTLSDAATLRLESEIADLHDALRRQGTALIAFGELRADARAGQSFAIALDAFTKAGAAGQNTAALALRPFAATPPPSWSALRTDLIRREAQLNAPAAPSAETAPDWQSKASAALRHLITVRPATDPALTRFDSAADAADPKALAAAFAALPAAMQDAMRPWFDAMQARAELDAALNALTLALETPAEPPASVVTP